PRYTDFRTIPSAPRFRPLARWLHDQDPSAGQCGRPAHENRDHGRADIGLPRLRLNATIAASSASDRTVERGSVGPVFKSSTVARLRHFATVLGLMPYSRLSCASEACDRCIAARTACVVVALP